MPTDTFARAMATQAMASSGKASGMAMSDAAARNNDAAGNVAQIFITGRGIYIKSSGAPTTDEASYGWAFTDAGGTIWRKAITRRVNAAEWGVTAHTAFDGSGNPIGTPADQAPILNALAAYMASNANGGVLSFEGLRGVAYLASSVYVPLNIDLDGVSTRLGVATGFRFRPRVDGVFRTATGATVSLAGNGHCREGILFWLNIQWTDPSNWVVAFPGLCGTIRNIYIDGLPTSGIKGFRFGGSYHFRSLKHFQVSTLIEKPGIYSDATVIADIDGGFRADDPSYYLINLPGLGDGVRIETVATGYTLSGSNTCNGLYLGGCAGGKVSGLINGIHTFYTSRAIAVDTFHLEDGQIIVDSADVSIRDGFAVNGNLGLPPIVIKNSVAGSNLSKRRVFLDNVNFIHPINRLGLTTQWAGTPVMDIDLQTSAMTLVTGAGNRRTIYVTGQTDWTQAHAPLIGRSTDSTHVWTDNDFLLADWKTYAHMLASAPATIANMKVQVSGVMQNRAISWNGITLQAFSGAAGTTGISYKGPTAPSGNRYAIRQLADPVRLIGRAPLSNPTVTTAALVNGQTSGLPGFKLNDTSAACKNWVMFEVYRDTGNTGSYDKRVLVPCDNADWFVDDGNALNSFAWEAYGPSASMLVANSSGMTVRAQYLDGVIRLLDSTVGPPTMGTWQAGDMIELPANAPDAYGMKKDGTRCRTGGSPGTWDDRSVSTLTAAGGSKTWDPPSVAAQAAGIPGTTATTVTLNGAVVGDLVVAAFSLALGGLRLVAEVTAADTVTVTLINTTASAIDLASGTLRVRKLV